MRKRFKNSERRTLFQAFLFVEFFVYSIWWFIVNWTDPKAYNPVWSRALVVMVPVIVYLISRKSKFVSKHIEEFFYGTLYLLILHNFHLKAVNFSNIMWPASTYITIVACAACFYSSRALALFSAYILALAIVISYVNGFIHPFYIPGTITILFAVNFSVYYRQRILEQLSKVSGEASRAQNALRLRDEFISIASHELKTPLTPMRLNVELLQKCFGEDASRNLSPEKIRQMLDTTQRQINRLSNLVEEMLDVSVLHSGRMKLHFESFDLSESLRKIASPFLKDGQSPPKLQLRLRMPQSLWVHWDLFRIEQVLSNLLRNAMMYGENRTVFVIVKKIGEKILVAVKDKGIGIAKGDQERIFSRFERAVSSENYNGLGLGLYISRKIVEAHGGQIGVRSQAGKGATFGFLIDQRPVASQLSFRDPQIKESTVILN